jgi:hypothetical protein
MARKFDYRNGVVDPGPESTARRGQAGYRYGRAGAKPRTRTGRPIADPVAQRLGAAHRDRRPVERRPTRESAPPATEPDRLLHTRSTYRLLVMRGLAPIEAANLTAYLSGIHVTGQGWKLSEVNQLLFLRELQRSGRFGKKDGIAVVH